MENINFWEMVGSVVAALIAAYALIKVSRIDNQDRIRRGLWSLEEYLKTIGKCIKNPSKENLEEYESYYLLANLYADEELRAEFCKINEWVKKGMWDEIEEELVEFSVRYGKSYQMHPFLPRRKHLRP